MSRAKPHPHPHRPQHRKSQSRGIALLLVLATLVLAVTAATGLARVALAGRLHAETISEELRIDDLLHAVDDPILDWLHRHAGRATLPIDATSPRFTVVDDEFILDDLACRITITAFDQCGMVGQNSVHSTMAALLPPAAFDLLAETQTAWEQSPGLDLLAASRLKDATVYPTREHTATPALGALLATHNPPRANRPAVVNINTAPLALVRAVYAARGMSKGGGIDAVIEARAAGRVTSPGAMTAPQQQSDLPVPVAMSTAWAFRIDITVGKTRRPWWCIYTDTGSNWERVQRLAITE
ncbi:MAG: hypothetical protein Q9O74_00980 [Planctomycetota bacterium]|nr:hypothetical protein [Planctomycetota bacterium]